MTFQRAICTALIALTTANAHAENWLDRTSEALTIASNDGLYRARISGLLDLEYFHFSDEAIGLVYTESSDFFNPRLTLFLDAQLGSQLYLFAQGRMDRGFDPSDSAAQARLDEWAVRWTPWKDGRFNLQAGTFATIVGTYVERHLSWDNPFVTAPLVYENITPIYDAEPPVSAGEFANGISDEKYDYNPVLWGPVYASGISVTGTLGQFDYAAEIKNAGLASRPESWSVTDDNFDHPSYSARICWRPDLAWKLGFSASEGPYYTQEAAASLPLGTEIGDYRLRVLGQDISYSHGHWQLWAEIYEARFEVPYAGDADSIGYYLEAKYKFSPALFGALRWNQQMFSDIPDGNGNSVPWANDIWRIDAALTYRFTPQTQFKVQYSYQEEKGHDNTNAHTLAAQVTVKF